MAPVPGPSPRSRDADLEQLATIAEGAIAAVAALAGAEFGWLTYGDAGNAVRCAAVAALSAILSTSFVLTVAGLVVLLRGSRRGCVQPTGATTPVRRAPWRS